jgi:predicted Zn finger-like uncharacterized protein
MRFQCPFCRGIVAVDNSDLGLDVQCGHCGEVVTVPQSRVATGAVIADFIILKELGRGGMGIVYLAHQISLDRPAAVKVLADNYANNAEFVSGFIKEARSAAKLNHPHIVQAYAVGEDEGVFYFAMEHIDGETMKSVLKRDKVIPVDQAVAVIQQISEALDYAWKEQRLIHRDIKPDNIMITRNGRAKLADLGLSRVAGEFDDSESDEVMGTPQYISPEHLTGAPMDVRSDLYSLGATFYHLVTGKFPFEGRTATEIARKHLEEKLVPPVFINPGVPDSISRVIEKMMEKNLKARYQSAEELVDDLRQIRRGKAPAWMDGKQAPAPGSSKKTIVKISGKSTSRNIPAQGGEESDESELPTVEAAAAPDMGASDAGRTRVIPDQEMDEFKASRKRKKALVLTVAALLAAAVCAGLFLLFKKGGKPAEGPDSSPKTAATTPPPPAQKTVQPYMERIIAVFDFVSKNPQDEKETWEKCSEFLRAFPAPSTPEEKEKFTRFLEIYVPLDEKIQARTVRDELRKKHAAVMAKNEAAARERAAKEKEAADQARRQKEAKEKLEREEKARADQAEKRVRDYSAKIEDRKNSMRAKFVDLSKQGKAKEAMEVFDEASREAVLAVDKSDREKKIAADFVEWANKMRNGLTEAGKIHRLISESGSELAGSQLELRVGVLGKIQSIHDGKVTVQLITENKSETIPVSELKPVFFGKLIDKAAKKLNDPAAAFYYQLSHGYFNTAKDDAPDDDWKKETSDTAYQYFKVKLKSGSEEDLKYLNREFGKNPDFKRVKKDLQIP